jgi:hypothetical protein
MDNRTRIVEIIQQVARKTGRAFTAGIAFRIGAAGFVHLTDMIAAIEPT